MPAEIREHDMVVFVHDLPAGQLYPVGSPFPPEGIRAGQTGAVVHIHGNGEAFEVEIHLGGNKFSVVTVERGHLLKLLNVPDSLVASA